MLGLSLLLAACSQSPTTGTEPNTTSSEETTSSQQTDAGDAPESSAQEATTTAEEAPSEAVPEKPSFPPTAPFPEIQGGQVLEDTNPDPKVVEVNLVAQPNKIQLSDTVTQIMYTYNGIVPGPIIRARVGDELIVHFTNRLQEPTTVHWHGLRIPDKMDGTPRVQSPIKAGESFTYKFKLREAGSFWYHPHVRSHAQVELGLYGMLIVQEKENIKFTRERSVILDDILIINGRITAPMSSHMEAMHGRNGNNLFMHGKLGALSIKAKTGEVERWRVVNVANARTMSMKFTGVKVRVIGTDGGLLAKPYFIPTTLHIAVGQRYDLEVTYEKPGDYNFSLMAPTQTGVQALPMVKVNVEGEATQTPSVSPNYPEIPALPERKSDQSVTMTFNGVNTANGIEWQINGKGYWKEPIYTFKEGETVTMTLRNLQAQEHPFHLHGQFFTVLKRDGKEVFEPGLKDSVLVGGNETVEIQAYFDNPGQWMAHCHILEHAELGMMGEIVVTPKP